MALGKAALWRLIPGNPAALKLDLPRQVRRQMTTWTAEEARQFLESTKDDRLAALWVLMLGTGLRRGEALGLGGAGRPSTSPSDDNGPPEQRLELIGGWLTCPPAVLSRPPGPATTSHAMARTCTCLLALAIVDPWIFFAHGLGTGFREVVLQPLLLLALYGVLVLSMAFHEFGHAAACRYGGARPGSIGVGLYLVWIVFTAT